MLNLKFIQENKDTVIRKLAVKNFDAKELVEKIIALDNERKNLQKESDNKQSEMNSISKQIGSLMKEGKKEEAEQARANTTRLKEEIAALTAQHNSTQNELNSLIVRLPNLPHDSVPSGKSDADNVIVKISDNVPAHEEGQLPHWDLAKKYQLIDFEVSLHRRPFLWLPHAPFSAVLSGHLRNTFSHGSSTLQRRWLRFPGPASGRWSIRRR